MKKCQKNTKKFIIFQDFSCKIGIKSKVDNFFQKMLQIFCLYMWKLYSKFHLDWTPNAKVVQKYVKHPKIQFPLPFLYKILLKFPNFKLQ